MQLEHTFTVPVGVDDAWAVLLDIERIAPCMPGAAIDSVDGDDFTGTVKVKLGPIGLTYKGKASFVEKDVVAHRAVIDARGRDSRGNGTANAKVTATLTQSGAATEVHVLTDLDITGKPAQFGRGVMVDVGNKLIGQFADCLAGKLTAGGGDAVPAPDLAAETVPAETVPAETVAAAEVPAAKAEVPAAKAEVPAAKAEVPAAKAEVPAAKAAEPARRAVAEVEPINLIESAGPAVAKRLIPVVAAVVVVLVVLRWRRSR
jgi:carbon monoxide dehydrogenase subunit G